MKCTLSGDDATKLATGLIGILCCEDSLSDPAVQAVDRKLDGLIAKLISEEQFKGKKGQTLQVHTHSRLAAQRILLVGGGPRKDFQPADLRGFAARVIKAAASVQA